MSSFSQKVDDAIDEARAHKSKILSIVEDFNNFAKSCDLDISGVAEQDATQDFTDGTIELLINEENLKKNATENDNKIKVSIDKVTGDVKVLTANNFPLSERQQDCDDEDYDYQDQLACIASRLTLKGLIV